MRPRDKAERGLALLKEAIVEILAAAEGVMRNSEVAEALRNEKTRHDRIQQDRLILGRHWTRCRGLWD